MNTLRPAAERGHFDHGWLRTWHSFSFADYHDPAHMGYRNLRVINEDVVVPGQGFGEHPHRDMEIITYVISGAVEHRDSMGTRSVVAAGEVQRMTAGSGVRHSEFNPSDEDPLHLLQIWIMPRERGLDPGYEQRPLALAEHPGEWQLVAAPAEATSARAALSIHQDVSLYAIQLPSGQQAAQSIAQGRAAWVQMVRGAAKVNGVELSAGDGLALSDVEQVEAEGIGAMGAETGAEMLLFDLA